MTNSPELRRFWEMNDVKNPSNELQEDFKIFMKKTGLKGSEAIKKYKEDCGQRGWESWITQQNEKLEERCLELERVIDSLRRENKIEAGLVKLCGEENKALKKEIKDLKLDVVISEGGL